MFTLALMDLDIPTIFEEKNNCSQVSWFLTK